MTDNYLLYLICLITILTINSISIHLQTKKLINLLSNVKTADVQPSFDEKKELTAYELEVLSREEEFDKRIDALKEDIRKGVQAEELHPLVHNLPHESVQSRYDLSTYEEVAE